MEKSNELIKVVESSGVESSTAIALRDAFMPLFEKAEEWKAKAENLVVTDVSQVEEMRQAREARLALKDIRVSADKVRKALKEDSLRYGRAVQGVYNVIEYLIVPIEKHLQDQENFAVVAEAKRKAELSESRIAEIEREGLSSFIPFGITMLGDLSEEDYGKMITGARLQLIAKQEQDRKDEEERIAREKAEAEERERVRLENESLRAQAEATRKEMEERERVFREEQKKRDEEAAEKIRAIEEKALKEAEAKARLEAELRAKKEAEENAIREAEEAKKREEKARLAEEKRAKSAPDRKKLESLVVVIDSITLPNMSTEEGSVIVENVKVLLDKVTTYILNQSKSL